MPIYEFRCKDCSRISEFLFGVAGEQPEMKCRFCGSKKLEKIFSRSNVRANSNRIGSQGGLTCCGRTERCDTPPCSDNGICQR
ncbi:MAG: zinc ribbon domain-containing protein [Candidatus Omnitrophota bacterium]|nr:MAG: zinc ribbon domain-containing protein [Candidatus Omnitrophota bacterium]